MSTKKLSSWKQGKVCWRGRLYLPEETWAWIERQARQQETQEAFVISKLVQLCYTSVKGKEGN